MARFQPEQTPESPVLVRNSDGQYVLLTDYQVVDGGVKPREGYEVTEAYEAQRARDAAKGVPFSNGAVGFTSVGSIAYRAVAASEGWTHAWEELSAEDQQRWTIAGSAVRSFLESGDSIFAY